MAVLSPEVILEYYYSKRIFSDQEVVSRFIEVAASVPPEQLIAIFPMELLDRLKEEVTMPPQSPDDIEFIHGHVPMQYENEAAANAAATRLEENQRAMKQAYFAGAMAWHGYFNRPKAAHR